MIGQYVAWLQERIPRQWPGWCKIFAFAVTLGAQEPLDQFDSETITMPTTPATRTISGMKSGETLSEPSVTVTVPGKNIQITPTQMSRHDSSLKSPGLVV